MNTVLNTTIQTMPIFSKKVTDMILYAVAREMAKKILAAQEDKKQNDSVLINKRKKAVITKRKKILLA
jgi:hypothetical protein